MANREEYNLRSFDRVLLDGEDITDQVGPVMEKNGRTLIWGRGFIYALNKAARESGATFPWATNAWAEWDPNGYATYTYLNMLTDWDSRAGAGTPSVIKFHTGTERGCGSRAVELVSWRTSISQEVFGPVRKGDRLILDTEACLFFASEKAYVSARAIAEAFKLRMTYLAELGEVHISTQQLAELHPDEIGQISIAYDARAGFSVEKQSLGFFAYPGTLLYASIAADSANKMAARVKSGEFTFTANDQFGAVDVTDTWGTLKGRVYATHFVIYYTEQQMNEMTNQMEKDNRWASSAGALAALLIPEGLILKVLGTGGSGWYYNSRADDVGDIKTCLANAKLTNKSNPVVGVIYVNPATFPLADRFMNNGIVGCVEHTGHISSDLGLGR